MHTHLRLPDAERVLFDSRIPLTAETIAGQIGVRREGVRHVLRLLELRGQVERVGLTPDKRPLWRWVD